MFTQTNKNTACVILQDDKIPWVNCYIIFIIFHSEFSPLLFLLYYRHPGGGRSFCTTMYYVKLPTPSLKQGNIRFLFGNKRIIS